MDDYTGWSLVNMENFDIECRTNETKNKVFESDGIGERIQQMQGSDKSKTYPTSTHSKSCTYTFIDKYDETKTCSYSATSYRITKKVSDMIPSDSSHGGAVMSMV